MKKYFGFIMAGALFFLSAPLVEAWQRWCQDGVCAKWKGNCPVVGYYINTGFKDAPAGVKDQQLQALIRGVEQWNFQGGACFQFQYLGETNISTVDTRDGKNVVVVRQASNGTALATAYASWKSNGEMNGFDVVFWDKNYLFSAKPQIANTEYDIWTVAAHEIGHGAGLDHSGVNTAILFPTIGSGQMKRNLSADDRSGLQAIYPRRDPPARQNNIWDIHVTQPAPSKLLVRFKYRYASANGLPIRFGARAYKGGQELQWFGYGPPRIERRGEGTTQVELSYAYNNPPASAEVDKIRIIMYTPWDRQVFFSRDVSHRATVRR